MTATFPTREDALRAFRQHLRNHQSATLRSTGTQHIIFSPSVAAIGHPSACIMERIEA